MCKHGGVAKLQRASRAKDATESSAAASKSTNSSTELKTDLLDELRSKALKKRNKIVIICVTLDGTDATSWRELAGLDTNWIWASTVPRPRFRLTGPINNRDGYFCIK